MSRKTPYTKVEVIEERHPNQPEDSPIVKVTHVLVNGKPVTVKKDGIWIDYGDADTKGEVLEGGAVTVQLELLVDEFRIHQVPNGYADNEISFGEAITASVEELAEAVRKASGKPRDL